MASDSTSGSASSFADVQTAIINFLTTHAWVDQSANVAGSRIISKGGLFVWLLNNTNELYAYPGTGRDGGTGALTGRPTASTGTDWTGAKMASPNSVPIVFPINYEIIWHDDPQEEVYVVISYGGDKYQHLNWGKTDIAGVGGTGMWLTGTARADMNVVGNPTASKMYITLYNENNGRGYIAVECYAGLAGGYFYEHPDTSYMPSFVNQGLEVGNAQNGWAICESSNAVGGLVQGYRPYSVLLMAALPSSFNEAEVLVPAMTTLRRASSLITPVVSMRHARKMRIDNVQPGEIITYGGDQWKCFPLYAKNTVQRNGVSWSTGANHSGTLGVAIRLPGA